MPLLNLEPLAKLSFTALILISACGKDDGSDSAALSILDPSNLAAVTFESFIPKTRTKSELATKMATQDLTNFTEKTANQACILSKIQCSAEGSDGYSLCGSDQVDITSCFAASEFSGYSSISVAIRYQSKAKVSIDRAEYSISGKTLLQVREALEAASVYDSEQLIRRRLVLDGIVKDNGNHEVIETVALHQNGDGILCKQGREKDGPHIEGQCQSYSLTTQTINASIEDQEFALFKFASDMKADSYKAKYFQDGAKASLTIDNWAGTVSYKGVATGPTYSLTDGKDVLESSVP